MVNVAKSINAFLAEKIALENIVNDEFFDDSSEGVISRHEPSTAKEKSFVDGSSEGVVNISYYARYKNAETARKTLTDILNAVDNVEIEDTQDRITITTEAETLPQFISTDEKGFSLYCANIRAEYIREPEEF